MRVFFIALMSWCAVLMAADPVAWAVVAVRDHTGVERMETVPLSRTTGAAPELKAHKDAVDQAFADANAEWSEAERAFRADASNRGKSYHREVPRPQRPRVVVDLISADRTAIDAHLAKRDREALARVNPGLAWRKQVMDERFLQYFTIGAEAPAEWHLEQQQMHGSRFATNMQYLSHVVTEAGDNGDNSWFFKYGAAEAHIQAAQKAGIVAWFTWYGLAEAPPARYQPNPPEATIRNAKVKETMWSYWTILARFYRLCAKYPDVPIVLHVEPDEWGHLLLGTQGMNAKQEGVVMVGGSGCAEVEGLPDSVAGWANGFRSLRDRHAPRVLLAANPSAWDWKGRMSGTAWVRYLKDCDVTPEGWDLFITQLHDWDSGLRSNGGEAEFPPYTEASVVKRFQSVDLWCQWIREIHEGTGLWGVAWQLPMGNTTYLTCDGSDGHGTDGVTELLLEDYPRNTVAQRMGAAGCCMWLFSRGKDTGTSVWDQKKDGVTNGSALPHTKGLTSLYADDDGGYLRLKGAAYFKQPVPIKGKPVAAKTSPRDRTRDEPVARPEPAPRATLQRSEARAEHRAALLVRVHEELAAGRRPTFQFAALRSQISLDSGSGEQFEGRLASGGVMQIAWSMLREDDCAELALTLLRSFDADDHARAAFFLLLAGRTGEANEHLGKAGAAAAAVRADFGL